MDMNSILKLVDAGFSKDEIMAMNSQEPDQEPDQTPDQEPDQEPDQKPAQEPTQDPTVMDAIALLTKQVEALTKAQQSANRNQTNLQRVTQNTDDILANLINPTKS